MNSLRRSSSFLHYLALNASTCNPHSFLRMSWQFGYHFSDRAFSPPLMEEEVDDLVMIADRFADRDAAEAQKVVQAIARHCLASRLDPIRRKICARARVELEAAESTTALNFCYPNHAHQAFRVGAEYGDRDLMRDALRSYLRAGSIDGALAEARVHAIDLPFHDIRAAMTTAMAACLRHPDVAPGAVRTAALHLRDAHAYAHALNADVRVILTGSRWEVSRPLERLVADRTTIAALTTAPTMQRVLARAHARAVKAVMQSFCGGTVRLPVEKVSAVYNLSVGSERTTLEAADYVRFAHTVLDRARDLPAPRAGGRDGDVRGGWIDLAYQVFKRTRNRPGLERCLRLAIEITSSVYFSDVARVDYYGELDRSPLSPHIHRFILQTARKRLKKWPDGTSSEHLCVLVWHRKALVDRLVRLLGWDFRLSPDDGDGRILRRLAEDPGLHRLDRDRLIEAAERVYNWTVIGILDPTRVITASEVEEGLRAAIDNYDGGGPGFSKAIGRFRHLMRLTAV